MKLQLAIDLEDVDGAIELIEKKQKIVLMYLNMALH